MGVTSPRTASFLAILVVVVYVGYLSSVPTVTPGINLIFMIIIGGLIGLAAFSFAAGELRETEGVNYTIDIGIGKLFALILFAFFIGIGYDGLILVIVEIFLPLLEGTSGGDTVSGLPLSTAIMALVVGFLIIFPFFQFFFLARPGEDSSIPAEYPLERIMEKLSGILRSPFIAALFAYFILYILPIGLLYVYVSGGNTIITISDASTAVVLWALLLPLITLGGLAGAGLGEDLIRLRLVRNAKDLPKLGLPRLNLRKLEFDFGGLFLVLFAIQALIVTLYYGLRGIAVWLDLISESVGVAGQDIFGAIFVVVTLFLTLFNKGRGAFKELKEVWTESGFKVSVFQLFLPVFVFLGVILSSALEVFVQQAGNATGVLYNLGLQEHVRLSSLFLALQNFVLIGTAVYILRTTPGTAERRLIKEVPDFYGDDLDGYQYIYNKLKDEKSIENLITELTKRISEDEEQIQFLKDLIHDTMKLDAPDVKIAIGEAVHLIARKEAEFNQDTYELTKELLESDIVGAQIYAIRTMKIMLQHLEGIEKEEALTYLQSFVSHPDSVVSWDSSIVLFRLLRDEPEYRSFVLAKMITALNQTTEKNTVDAINRFFRKIAEESAEIGQMAASTLVVRLSSEDIQNSENLISGIKALLRGNSYLVEDLIDQIAVNLDHPDLELRQNAFHVLANLAQYGAGKEQEILQLIVRGIEDDNDKIQEIAYDALAKEVDHAPELIPTIFVMLQERFHNLRGVPLMGALDVINQIGKLTNEYDEDILILIIGAANSSTPKVRKQVLEILGDIALKNTSLSEDVYRIAEANLPHDSEIVRQASVAALGRVVVGNDNFAQSVYRQISKSRDDESYIVQLAAIEALGYVASASQRLAEEIFESLLPLLDDDDWQVRLAALNGLFSAAEVRSTLVKELVSATIKAMKDPNRSIRLRTLDIITWLMDNYRTGAETILSDISKNIKRSTVDEYTTMVNAMEIIAEHNILLLPKIINNLKAAYEQEDNNLRFSANEALKAVIEKTSSSRNVNTEVKKGLNSLVSVLMKAANNSSAKVRQSAYTALTEIPAGLPEINVADRCRNALAKAKRLEKDIALIEYLEEANIRAKKPLDFDFSGKIEQ